MQICLFHDPLPIMSLCFHSQTHFAHLLLVLTLVIEKHDSSEVDKCTLFRCCGCAIIKGLLAERNRDLFICVINETTMD